MTHTDATLHCEKSGQYGFWGVQYCVLMWRSFRSETRQVVLCIDSTNRRTMRMQSNVVGLSRTASTAALPLSTTVHLEPAFSSRRLTIFC